MLSGEIKLVRGFKTAMSKLQKSLTRAQEFLSDAEEKEIRDKSVRDWLKDLEDVAFEADDVLDEFNYHLFQNKLKHQKQGPKKPLPEPLVFKMKRSLKAVSDSTKHEVADSYSNIRGASKDGDSQN